MAVAEIHYNFVVVWGKDPTINREPLKLGGKFLPPAPVRKQVTYPVSSYNFESLKQLPRRGLCGRHSPSANIKHPPPSTIIT